MESGGDDLEEIEQSRSGRDEASTALNTAVFSSTTTELGAGEDGIPGGIRV